MFILERLGRWSLKKLVLVCIGWLAVCIVAPIAYVAVMILVMTMGDSGSGGIGAVSTGFLALPLIFGPIVVLVVLWIVARRRASGSEPQPGRSGTS